MFHDIAQQMPLWQSPAMDDDPNESGVVTQEPPRPARSATRRIGEGRRPRPAEQRTLLETPRPAQAKPAPSPPPAPRRGMGGPGPSNPYEPDGFHMDDVGQPPMDDLQSIVNNSQYPMVLRVLAQRLAAAEQNLPDTMRVGQSLIQLDTRMRQLEPQVQHLSTQRAVSEMSLERHTRSTALDLAIKAVPEAQRGEPDAADTIVILAGAFLDWMKTGENYA